MTTGIKPPEELPVVELAASVSVLVLVSPLTVVVNVVVSQETGTASVMVTTFVVTDAMALAALSAF